jgi:hypothetical protein
MKLAYWLNTAWMWKCRSEGRAFRRATRAVAETQAALLRTILRQNALTLFGCKHDFHAVNDVRQYQRRVPLSTFDDYSGWIELIAAGVPNVLTRQPVELLEPTSGTTRAEKWIPYTGSLRAQFQRGIAAWIADLMSRRPAVRRGRAYWSVSPSFGPPRGTAAGIPVGFDDDTAYLGRWERFAASRVLAVPPSVAKLPDVAGFRYLTLLHLVRTSDLTLISVWSPAFLTALLARLDEWHERLCFDIGRGIAIPGEVAESGQGVLVPARFPPDPPRAVQLRSIFSACRSFAEKLRMIWPRLALISCWADGPARWAAQGVENLFPDVEIQPKGLIATEAFVSLPLVGRPGAALSLRSHFFEFEEVCSTGEGGDQASVLRMSHELERGGRYRVVVTTGGGLYRYQLRDEVAVVGFENGCPLLRFLGKADGISDLVGEKLSEPHVRQVLHRIFSSTDLSPTFALVVPVEGTPPRYRLYLEGLKEQHGSPTAVSLVKSLEDGLRENPYYRYAVSLGQLAPAEVNLLDDASPSGRARYERRCLELGQKLGDIKPTTLDSRPGWAEVFAPSAGVDFLTTDERAPSGSTG